MIRGVVGVLAQESGEGDVDAKINKKGKDLQEGIGRRVRPKSRCAQLARHEGNHQDSRTGRDNLSKDLNRGIDGDGAGNGHGKSVADPWDSCYAEGMTFSALFKRICGMATLIALVVSVVPAKAHASTALWRGYGATLVGGVESPTVMRTGDTQTVRFRVRNTGTTTWSSSGGAYVSLYHWNPTRKVETASSLADTSWITNFQVARLPVPELRPGEETNLTFRVRAPSLPGTYSGEFILAAEDVAWLQGSRFRVDLRVEASQAPVAGAVTPTAPSASTPSASVEAPPSTPLRTEASGRYRARIMNAGGSAWALESGQDVSVRMVFQNMGEVPWPVSGASSLRLVTIDEKNALRESAFVHPRWASASVITTLSTHTSLGSEAAFSFIARAPERAGIYRERFALATLDGTLVPGSIIETDITVAADTGFVATDVSDLSNQPIIQTAEDSLPAVPRAVQDGKLMTVGQISTPLEYDLPGNGRQQLSIGWKNTGTEAWSRVGMRLVDSTPWVKASWLADATWSDSRPPEASVIARPNDTVYYTFFVKAPPKRGSYQLRFRVFANGQPVEGGELLVMVRVTSDGYIAPNDALPHTSAPTPSTPSGGTTQTPSQPPLQAQPIGGDPSQLPSEPMIRAGLYQPPHEALQVQTLTSGATVFLAGTAVCSIATGQAVRITYLRGTNQYALTGDGGCSGVASTPYQVRSNDGIAPLRIADFVRPSHWISNATDRDFRGQLELRASNNHTEIWVINELPVEWYLKGIAETSNISPTEFQRTLLVAARTYAMYHVGRGTKHATKGFTVEATLDQVYRGYAMELRAPRIGQAVDATRGQIVTYQGRLAITPYFSRSDGRTRSWGEVWAGGSNYPWLIGVPVPQDQGRTLWGHGVGMSATGALTMANEGRTYNEILTYFYTGIQVLQAYR